MSWVIILTLYMPVGSDFLIFKGMVCICACVRVWCVMCVCVCVFIGTLVVTVMKSWIGGWCCDNHNFLFLHELV